MLHGISSDFRPRLSGRDQEMKIVWLEQSGVAPDDAAWQRMVDLKASGIDYLRLNWNTKCADELAQVRLGDITWSEGRNHLYEVAKGAYNYYIFADDDLRFESPGAGPYTRVRSGLERWKPLTGTLRSPQDWAQAGSRHIPIHKAARIVAHDQQVQIVSSEISDELLPGPHIGAHASMWHIQFTGFECWPERQLVIPSDRIQNTRSLGHDHEAMYPNFQTAANIYAELLRQFDFLRHHGLETISSFRRWARRKNSRLALRALLSSPSRTP